MLRSEQPPVEANRDEMQEVPEQLFVGQHTHFCPLVLCPEEQSHTQTCQHDCILQLRLSPPATEGLLEWRPVHLGIPEGSQ